MATARDDLHLHVGTSADSKGLADAARHLDDTKKSSDELGGSFKETGQESKHLDSEIGRLESHIRELGEEFDRTGNKDVFRQIRRDRGELGLLRSVRKELMELAHETRGVVGEFEQLGDRAEFRLRELGGGGRSFLRNLREGVADFAKEVPKAFASLGSANLAGPLKIGLIAGLVQGAIIASPAIGAAVAGAVAGLGGTLGVAGGVAAAAQSEQVKTAFKSMGQAIAHDFETAGRAAVPSVLRSLLTLRSAFADLNLGGAFAKAAPSIETIAKGIGDLARNFMPGFNAMLERAGPFAQVAAKGFGDIGTALGNFLDYASQSRGALLGLQGMFDFIAATIATTGRVLRWFSDRYYDMVEGITDTSGFLADAFRAIGQTDLANVFQSIEGAGHRFLDRMPKDTGTLNDFGDAMDDSATKTEGLRKALENANKAYDDFFDKNMSVDQARLAVQQGLLALKQQLAENKDEWSINTEEGLKNREMLLQQVEHLKRLRDASIAAGDGSQESVDKANRAYDKEIEKLRALAKEAGISEQAFQDLAGDYKIRVFVDQVAGKQVVAWSQLRNQERQQESSQRAQAPVMTYGGGRASGGPVLAGIPYTINERARETVTFPANGMVHAASLTPAGGGGRLALEITARPTGNALLDAIIEGLSYAVRTRAGGDVQALFSGSRG